MEVTSKTDAPVPEEEGSVHPSTGGQLRRDPDLEALLLQLLLGGDFYTLVSIPCERSPPLAGAMGDLHVLLYAFVSKFPMIKMYYLKKIFTCPIILPGMMTGILI